MSEPILILGPSGGGKSFACRNMNPKTSLFISVDGKRPPFSLKEWPRMTAETPNGSFYVPRRENPYGSIKGAIQAAIKDGKKDIVIDDSQFLLSNDFFAKAQEKGYEKFTQMGQQFWTLIEFCRDLPEDVIVYFLHHPEYDAVGNIQVKTIGKMLSEKGCVEGRFTVCLWIDKKDGVHSLISSHPDQSIIKSPPDMLPEKMDNDFSIVGKSVREYWGL